MVAFFRGGVLSRAVILFGETVILDLKVRLCTKQAKFGVAQGVLEIKKKIKRFYNIKLLFQRIVMKLNFGLNIYKLNLWTKKNVCFLDMHKICY